MLLGIPFFIFCTLHFYRPQRSCGQGNIFTPVCHSFCSQGGWWGVCLSACWDTTPRTRHPLPLEPDTPPNRHTPRDQTPRSRHPLEHAPPETRPPQSRHTPPEADSSIRSTSGRYASYWIAFLYYFPCTAVASVHRQKTRE